LAVVLLVLDVNQYFASLMGYDSPEEVNGKEYSIDFYANPGDRQRMKEIERYRELLAGQPASLGSKTARAICCHD
jgi:PAS domain-containing protein